MSKCWHRLYSLTTAVFLLEAQTCILLPIILETAFHLHQFFSSRTFWHPCYYFSIPPLWKITLVWNHCNLLVGFTLHDGICSLVKCSQCTLLTYLQYNKTIRPFKISQVWQFWPKLKAHRPHLARHVILCGSWALSLTTCTRVKIIIPVVLRPQHTRNHTCIIFPTNQPAFISSAPTFTLCQIDLSAAWYFDLPSVPDAELLYFAFWSLTQPVSDLPSLNSNFKILIFNL